ncbi:MAG: hypothetical protein ACR2H1_10385, partial [Limisphaerales bacterium]
MKPSIISLTLASFCALLVLLFTSVAQAHPYASAVTNSGGNIQFILNESADNVTVTFDNNTVTNNLGALAKGPQSFPLGTHTNYSIIVFKVGAGVPTQISDDTNNFVKFNSPRGVAVNTNASSPYFGRAYVANSAVGAAGGRTLGDGIYVLKPDLSDGVGQGDTASTSGIDFGTGAANSPFKIGVGDDNRLYINDFSTPTAATWSVDPNVSAGSSNMVFEGIGETTNPTVHTRSASTPIVKGTLAAGNMVIYM